MTRSGSSIRRRLFNGALVMAAGFGCLPAPPIAAASGRPSPPKAPATILMDGRYLAAKKQRIVSGDTDLKPAMTNLIGIAEAAMQTGPFSVTDKTRIPAGADRHDYASYARYWWPDPERPDGLPYIQRDGETNPETLDYASTDRYRMDEMAIGAETLALAYYFTGEQRYAEKAAELIRAWFLDPETRMNPNMNFSQGIPGVATGKFSGVIDSRTLIRALDGALLIEPSGALTASEMEDLRQWAARFVQWLKTSEQAIEASDAANNHGVFYDVQGVYYALFSGDTGFARELAGKAAKRRIMKQIERDGSLPHELRRTRSLHYTIFSVQAFFELARLAELAGVDLWHAGDKRIKAALDYVAPYADPAREWPRDDIAEADRTELLWPLLYAAQVYKDRRYIRLAEKLPEYERIIHRANLAAPMMH